MGLQRYCFVCNTSDHWTNTPECPKQAAKLIAAQPSKPIVAQPKVVEQAIVAPTKIVEQPPPKIVAPIVEQSKPIVARYGPQAKWQKRNAEKMRAYHRDYMRELRKRRASGQDKDHQAG